MTHCVWTGLKRCGVGGLAAQLRRIGCVQVSQEQITSRETEKRSQDWSGDHTWRYEVTSSALGRLRKQANESAATCQVGGVDALGREDVYEGWSYALPGHAYNHPVDCRLLGRAGSKYYQESILKMLYQQCPWWFQGRCDFLSGGMRVQGGGRM